MPLAQLLGATLRRPGLEGGAQPRRLRRRRAAAAAAPLPDAGDRGAARRARTFRGDPRMSLLPDIDRILLGPGPSLTSPRVMRAMAAPDAQPSRSADAGAARRCARARLTRLFRAPEGSFAFAVSGTGTSGMETAVANLVARRHARRWSSSPAISAIGWRRCASATARRSTRLDVEWGRACDPDALRARAEGDAGRHRRDGARRNVDRRAESGRRAGGDRARARRADDRRRGHLVRRPSARRRRVGHRRRATAARRSASARRRAWRRSSSVRARSSSA